MAKIANVALEIESRPDTVQHVSKQPPDHDVHGTALLQVSAMNYNMAAVYVTFDNEQVSDQNIAKITLYPQSQLMHVSQRPSKWTAARPGESVADIGEWRSVGGAGHATIRCTAHILDIASRSVADIDVNCTINVQKTKPQPRALVQP